MTATPFSRQLKWDDKDLASRVLRYRAAYYARLQKQHHFHDARHAQLFPRHLDAD